MNKILNGKEFSKEIENEIKIKVNEYVQIYNKRPKLVTIMVGDSIESLKYVNMKEKACKRVGIDAINVQIAMCTTEELLKIIDKLNQDENVNGILIQHPLPECIDESLCLNKVLPEKDVDGLTLLNFAQLSIGTPNLVPCTPKGIIHLLKKYNIELEGKKAIVIGRSRILGKPLAMMLLEENATVTIAHSKTKDIEKLVKESDIVCACCGVPKFVQKEWIKEGAIIIDAGYNAGNIGDVDPTCYEVASLYTPVPGGVGPMTITELVSQTLEAFEKQNNIKVKKLIK